MRNLWTCRRLHWKLQGHGCEPQHGAWFLPGPAADLPFASQRCCQQLASRSLRYPFAGAGEQQIGQLGLQGQGQFQIDAPHPLPQPAHLALAHHLHAPLHCSPQSVARHQEDQPVLWQHGQLLPQQGGLLRQQELRMSCFGSRCSCKISSVCSLHGGQFLFQGSSRSCHHQHKKAKWTHRGGLGKPVLGMEEWSNPCRAAKTRMRFIN